MRQRREELEEEAELVRKYGRYNVKGMYDVDGNQVRGQNEFTHPFDDPNKIVHWGSAKEFISPKEARRMVAADNAKAAEAKKAKKLNSPSPINQAGSGRDYPPSRACLLYTSPSPRDLSTSRMPSSA